MFIGIDASAVTILSASALSSWYPFTYSILQFDGKSWRMIDRTSTSMFYQDHAGGNHLPKAMWLSHNALISLLTGDL